MSIEATEYVYMPAGAVPIIVVSNSTQSADIVRITITGVDTDSGIRFLEWLRDKIRADQEAAKAFAVVTDKLPPEALDSLKKSHPGRVELLTEVFNIGGHPIINEGDTAPTADVIALARTHFDAP